MDEIIRGSKIHFYLYFSFIINLQCFYVADKASEAASITSLTEIVKALEVDSGFLELVSKQQEEDSEETEILTAISENLEKLRHLVMNSPKTSPKASPKEDLRIDLA